ncbi:hypothetical protein ACP70R_040015 [Stipagrostis hirtigluma subsp. patula]
MADAQVKLPNVAGVATPSKALVPPPHPPIPPKTVNAAYPGYTLAVKHGLVVLVPPARPPRPIPPIPPIPPHNEWKREDREDIRDAEGRPAFALVNHTEQAHTEQAIQRPAEESQPVRLVPYNHNRLDRSVLWTKKEVAEGFHINREVDNIELVWDAVPIGTDIVVVVSKYNGAASQKWTIP